MLFALLWCFLLICGGCCVGVLRLGCVDWLELLIVLLFFYSFICGWWFLVWFGVFLGWFAYCVLCIVFLAFVIVVLGLCDLVYGTVGLVCWGCLHWGVWFGVWFGWDWFVWGLVWWVQGCALVDLALLV